MYSKNSSELWSLLQCRILPAFYIVTWPALESLNILITWLHILHIWRNVTASCKGQGRSAHSFNFVSLAAIYQNSWVHYSHFQLLDVESFSWWEYVATWWWMRQDALLYSYNIFICKYCTFVLLVLFYSLNRMLASSIKSRLFFVYVCSFVIILTPYDLWWWSKDQCIQFSFIFNWDPWVLDDSRFSHIYAFVMLSWCFRDTLMLNSKIVLQFYCNVQYVKTQCSDSYFEQSSVYMLI